MYKRKKLNFGLLFLVSLILVFSVPAISTRASEVDSTEHTHNWSNWAVETEADCTDTGSKSRYCIDCGEYEFASIPINPKAHTWDSWYDVKDPTVFKNGIKERECYYCGKTEQKSIKRLSAKIKLSPKKVTLSVGKTKKLKITKAYGDKIASIKSSKPSVASVSSSGKIKAKKAGKATITVKLKSGKKAKCKVTVKKKKAKKKKAKKKSSSNSGGGKVYWVPSGKVYHNSRNCPTLKRSRTIYSGSPPSGRRKCKVCY